MKFIPKILALLLVFGISTFSVFAINSPINVLSSNVTETNSLLSWDAAENALGYNVYFSTVSPIELLTAEKKEYINGLGGYFMSVQQFIFIFDGYLPLIFDISINRS